MKRLLVLILFLMPMLVSAQSGRAAIIMETNSGRVLLAENEQQSLLVASAVKIMTAVVVIESGKINDVVTIDSKVASAPGAGVDLVASEQIKVNDLLYALMLRSGNDAAVALAKHVSGSEAEFINKMRATGQKIGLTNSTFRNPSGLDDVTKNYMSAHDLALLYRYAMKNDQFRKIVSTKNYAVKTNKHNFNWENKNKMIGYYKYATGGKTGYTSSSGKTLVTSAKRGQTELVIITINDEGYYKKHIGWYKEYYALYHTTKLINHLKYRVPNDKYYKNNLIIKKDFLYPVTKEELASVTRKLKITKKTKKPAKVGYVEILINNQVVGTVDVYYQR